MDIGYVFGTFEDEGLDCFFGRGEDSRMVSEAVQRAWTRFARYGAPDVEYEWPAYDAANRRTMVFGYDAGLRTNIWRELDPAWYRVGTEILRRY